MDSFFMTIGVVVLVAIAIGIFAMVHPYNTPRQKTVVDFAFKLGGALMIVAICAVMITAMSGPSKPPTTVIEEVK